MFKVGVFVGGTIFLSLFSFGGNITQDQGAAVLVNGHLDGEDKQSGFYKKEGDLFFKEGLREKAKEAYAKMLFELESGAPSKAGSCVADIQKMLVADSDVSRYAQLIQKGVFAWNDGDFSLALQCAGDAIEYNSISPVGYILRATYWIASSEAKKALVDLEILEEMYPDFSYTYWLKGMVFFKQGEWDNSLVALKKRIELKPSDQEAYYHSARAYAVLGKNELALRYYTKSLELREEERAYFYRGVLCHSMERVDDALLDYLKALELGVSNSPYRAHLFFRIASIHIGKQEYDEANNFLDGLIELKPSDSWAYERKGLIYASQGRYNEARDLFKRAANLNADPVLIQQHLKRLEEAEKETSGAQKRETDQSLNPDVH